MPPWFARLRSGATACALAGLLAACSSPYHYADPARPHHLADRFTNWGESGPSPTVPWYEALGRNLRGDFRPTREPEGGYAAFAERWRVPLAPAQLQPPPQGQARLAWLGHAGVLLQVDGQNVLIDPQLSDYAGPLPWLSAKRRVPAPIAPEALPRIDLLLITHNHYDHLDAATLARLRAAGQDPRVLVPLGLKAWFEAQGWSGVEELDWWDTRQLGALGVMLIPSQHWSKRTPTDTNQTLWGGWALTWARPGGAAPWRFVHTGDTAWNPALYQHIAQRLGGPVDLLALPVGAYEPRDFMRRHHLNPGEAVQLLQTLQARQAFGIHWGTFELSHEPFDQPPRDLAQALAAQQVAPERVWLLRQGETRPLPF